MFSHNMLYAHEITLVNACTEYGRDDFFSYLTDFSYFSVNFFFLENCRTQSEQVKKRPL